MCLGGVVLLVRVAATSHGGLTPIPLSEWGRPIRGCWTQGDHALTLPLVERGRTCNGVASTDSAVTFAADGGETYFNDSFRLDDAQTHYNYIQRPTFQGSGIDG